MKQQLSVLCILVTLLGLPPMLSVKGQSATDKAARIIDQFGALPNGDLRGRFDLLLAEVSNNPGSTAIVHTRGTRAQVAARTRYYKNQLAFRQFDASRIKFIEGRNVGEIRTDMWLIPAGSAPPEFKPESWIVVEFGRAYKRDAEKRIATFSTEVKKLGNHQGYIINYGTPAQIALRENWIREAMSPRDHDGMRITLVNGGLGPVRTVMWLVPPGAANPTP